MFALRSQIFEYLREPFCSRALEYLQSARSERRTKKMLFSYETPNHYWHFLKACGRWGHVFPTSASPRPWTQKLAMSPSSTVHGGQYDTYQLCDIRVYSASGIRMDLPAADCKLPGSYKSLLVSGGKSCCAVRNIPKKLKRSAAAFLARFWLVSGPAWGSRLGLGLLVSQAMRTRDYRYYCCLYLCVFFT